MARLLDHLHALHAALAGQLTSTGSTGQTVAHPLLAELRAGRRELLEGVGDAPPVRRRAGFDR
ncbi:MAG: hypothetical protein ABI807_09280 [Sporichthyaceae bacterium]